MLMYLCIINKDNQKSRVMDKIKDLDVVANMVCRVYDLKRYELDINTRKRRISEPRQVAMYLAWLLKEISYRDIAAYFNKTRCVVYYTVEKMRYLHTIDKGLKSIIDRIIDLLK